MAGRRNRRKRTLRAGTVVLGLLLTLLLSAAAVGGVYVWASHREGPVSQGSSGGEPAPVRLQLYTEAASPTQPVPESAPAPEFAVSEESLPYGLAEIVAQEDGLMIGRVMGKRYMGFLAVVDDPSRLQVGTCPYFGDDFPGRTVKQMADESGAVLAVNGGGFDDPGGDGSGGRPTGNVIVNGEVRWADGGYTVGCDAQGKLHAGYLTIAGCRELGLQWALSYGPTLIQDGQICPNLDNRMEEPRTAVGQTADGKVLILLIQGRQVSALGVTCQELAEIMYGFGCVNAGNLDGGASVDMYYRGEYVNICHLSGGPRPIPTSLLVMPLDKEE